MKEPHQITTASTMNILVIVKIKVKIIVTIIRTGTYLNVGRRGGGRKTS